MYKDSECTVDCLLVYVAVEEQHEPIKSQCSVHLVSKPRERERMGEKDSGWEGGEREQGDEETREEGEGGRVEGGGVGGG